MKKTKISWADYSWNPVTGCTPVSEGCENCYAKRLSDSPRMQNILKYKVPFSEGPVFHAECLDEPSKVKKSSLVFLNSMSDTFHADVTDKQLNLMYEVMSEIDRHTYLVLTKRTARMMNYSYEIKWNNNIWAGTTIENDKYFYRADQLRDVRAMHKFISFEPLLSDVSEIDLSGIDWVIVGGETGPNCRTMNKDWVLSLQNRCKEYEIPFFFKQWGGRSKSVDIDGGIYQDYPHSIERKVNNQI